MDITPEDLRLALLVAAPIDYCLCLEQRGSTCQGCRTDLWEALGAAKEHNSRPHDTNPEECPWCALWEAGERFVGFDHYSATVDYGGEW